MLKTFIQKFTHKKKFSLRKTEHTHQAWLFALGVFIVVTIVIVIFSAYVFLDVDKDDIYIVDASGNGDNSIIDQKLLNQTIEFYTDKQKRFEQYLIEKPNIPTI